jgi:hypothetical protein
MEKLKPKSGENSKGSALIDILVAMILVTISLTVIFFGISSIGKQASVNRDRGLQLIELRNSREMQKKSEFYYKEK